MNTTESLAERFLTLWCTELRLACEPGRRERPTGRFDGLQASGRIPIGKKRSGDGVPTYLVVRELREELPSATTGRSEEPVAS